SPAASAAPAMTPGVAALPPARGSAVEAAVVAAMQRLGVPGLSPAVVRQRELRWSAGLGMADRANDVPAPPATVYRLASVAKPITATLALQLAEKARLDLDAPIQRYVPAFPEKPWPITARQLLAHQSGIRNWTDTEFHNTHRYTSLADALAPFRDDALLFEPGTSPQDPRNGFTLSRAAVEAAGG